VRVKVSLVLELSLMVIAVVIKAYTYNRVGDWEYNHSKVLFIITNGNSSSSKAYTYNRVGDWEYNHSKVLFIITARGDLYSPINERRKYYEGVE
jgi:hypothetical protein